MESTVSIIIPAYNVEDYIERCLDSVLNQTYENIEVIVVDDGSTDDTFKICENYLEIYNPKIKLAHQENNGRSAARKKGLNMASGEYVLFVDSDDWIEKNMVERMHDELIDEQADMIQCKMIEDYPDRESRFDTVYNEKLILDNVAAIKNMNYGEVITASQVDKMFRKDCIKDSFFSDHRVTIGEDYRFTVELLCNIKKIVFIPDVLYHYCLRSNNTSYTGYTGNGYAIIHNYTDVKTFITETYPQIYSSAVAYWVLQEMAVIISMVKADLYDRDVIRKVQGDLREEFKGYCRDKNVPAYLKICCLLSVVNPWVLVFVYKYLFKKRYLLEGKKNIL